MAAIRPVDKGVLIIEVALYMYVVYTLSGLAINLEVETCSLIFLIFYLRFEWNEPCAQLR
jgi:hypothetical protein